MRVPRSEAGRAFDRTTGRPDDHSRPSVQGDHSLKPPAPPSVPGGVPSAASEAGLIPGLRVVVLTTEGQVEMVQRAKALGAKAWILKPFKAELIIAAAERLATAA